VNFTKKYPYKTVGYESYKLGRSIIITGIYLLPGIDKKMNQVGEEGTARQQAAGN